MKISARNILVGEVCQVTPGEVNTLVEVALPGGGRVHATVTLLSAERMGLKPGRPVKAIVKSSAIIVGKDLHRARLSARNILCGEVCKLVDGPVSAEVDIVVAPGQVISSIITHESLRSLDLKVGEHACGIFKASSVILALD
nr:TOBE domain-containing protein [uncultured Holophaga sp.]